MHVGGDFGAGLADRVPYSRMDHDQNFKNLVLDYPRAALAFCAEAEAQSITPDVRITPVREEQLKERLGERFRELDIPLLVEWPHGRRAALVFVIEEETDPARFSVVRLAHYPRKSSWTVVRVRPAWCPARHNEAE